MMDSVFILPPIFDESYYGAVIHEIREMQIMNMGNYAHGNQPIQHMLYMYNYSGQPWKAQHWIREVMDKLYTPAPDGYCGDEDNGQTSAWYVFSAMGFYPVCPGTDEYVLGTPYFKEMKLHLENGKTVTISAPNNGDDKRYISSMTLNGKEYTKNYLTHQDLLNGASISYKMDAKPNQTNFIPLLPTVIAVMRTTARLLPGMYSRQWDSIRYVRVRMNMFWVLPTSRR